MVISDETLAAYAGGGLSARGRREVEAVLSEDAALVRRLEALLGAAAEIHAPVRLTAVEGGARHAAPVVDLASVRAARMPPPPPRTRFSGMAPWYMAGAALLIGLIAGRFLLPGSPLPLVGRAADGFVAQGELAEALNHRLSTAPQEGRVRLGYSFSTSDDTLCRTFQITGVDPRAGIACREAARWRIRMITTVAAHPTDAEPALVRQAVAEIRSGGPLGAAAESQALRR